MRNRGSPARCVFEMGRASDLMQRATSYHGTFRQSYKAGDLMLLHFKKGSEKWRPLGKASQLQAESTLDLILWS